MMKRLIAGVVVLAAIAGGTGWVLSAPGHLPDDWDEGVAEGDAAKGELVFWAGGCASCHAAPGSSGDDKLVLSGGLHLETPFGTFVVPNISSDGNDGIGAWTLDEFANAMKEGTSPQGRNYYPAFPYTSYARMAPQDVTDLFAFLKTLPAVSGKAGDHLLGFPYNLRRGLGLWKRLYLKPGPVIETAALQSEADGEVLARGQYLVEGLGHCGECHTPRDMAGGLKLADWLDGAPAATGEGKVPGISPGHAIDGWSQSDIAYYLESGFTPDFDSVGGEMVDVQENMARLPASDRDAIAAYLLALPGS